MPESRRRKPKNAPSTGRAATTAPKRKPPSPPWYGAVMIGFFALGVVWLVLYYTTGGSLPVISSLAGWNLLVGFGFICVGFGLATNWR